MTLKRALPVIIAAVLFSGLGITIAVLLALSRDDQELVVRAAEKAAVEVLAKEGREKDVDYVIRSFAVFSQEARRAVVRVDILEERPAAPLYLEMAREGDEWRLGADLRERFGEYIKAPARQEAMAGRFREAAAGRYPGTAELDGPSFRFRLSDDGKEVLVTTDLPFEAGGTQGKYIETYRYQGGEWAIQGTGRFFEAVGR